MSGLVKKWVSQIKHKVSYMHSAVRVAEQGVAVPQPHGHSPRQLCMPHGETAKTGLVCLIRQFWNKFYSVSTVHTVDIYLSPSSL